MEDEVVDVADVGGHRDERRRVCRVDEDPCADGARLPFGDGTADLLFSNLMLHWHPTPHLVFPEWKRVLRIDVDAGYQEVGGNFNPQVGFLSRGGYRKPDVRISLS